MFLTNEEMKTHLYEENINVIQRGDEKILRDAILIATAEVKTFLGNYDTNKIFKQTGEDRNFFILGCIKDIAAYRFVILSRAGADIKAFEALYFEAERKLTELQKGNRTLDLPKENENGENGAGIIKFGSNEKREQHF